MTERPATGERILFRGTAQDTGAAAPEAATVPATALDARSPVRVEVLAKKEKAMHMSKLRNVIAIGCCAVVAGVAPGVASATPGTGVGATTLTTGTSSGGMEVNQHGPTDVTVREITIEPGGSTGWHYHTGQLVAVVQAGTLTRQLEDCSEVATPAGQAFVEPAGPQHVHVGRNLGTEPVVLYVTYVLPAGSPLSVDAPDPGCGR